MESTPVNPNLQTTTATARLRAITRELANKSKAKGERIDVAVRRLGVLADDMDAGVES